FSRAGCRSTVVFARQLIKSGAEILGLAEVTIDRRKTYIGDVVELAQMLHHDFADRFRRNLALALAFQFAHDFRDHLLDALRLDRSLAQRYLHGTHELVAIKGNAAAVALYDGQFAQLHAFEGREAEIAGQANTAAADHSRIFGRPRVLHLRIEAAATRATHAAPNPQS